MYFRLKNSSNPLKSHIICQTLKNPDFKIQGKNSNAYQRRREKSQIAYQTYRQLGTWSALAREDLHFWKWWCFHWRIPSQKHHSWQSPCHSKASIAPTPISSPQSSPFLHLPLFSQHIWQNAIMYVLRKQIQLRPLTKKCSSFLEIIAVVVRNTEGQKSKRTSATHNDWSASTNYWWRLTSTHYPPPVIVFFTVLSHAGT